MKLNIKKPIYSAIIFFLTLGVLYISYGAYSTITKVGTGSGLLSDEWNKMVDNLEDLNSRSWKLSGNNLYYKYGTDDNTYNIGIGTENPLRKLSIHGGGLAFQEVDGSNRTIHWGDENTNIFPITINGYSKAGSEYLSFNTNTFGNNAIERMRISSNGNVGIGTTSPTQKLEVNGSFLNNGQIASVGNVGTDIIRIQPGDDLNPNFNAFTIGNSTWTSWPIQLRKNGSAYFVGAITSAGFITSSDLRLKKDILNIQTGISTINNLRGVTYHWKDNNKDKDLQYGFIAQEVEKVLPDLVKTDDKGYKSVNYIGVIPVLVKALQEQQKQIELQNNRIIELEEKINK